MQFSSLQQELKKKKALINRMNSLVQHFSENFQKSKKYQRFSCFKRKNLLWHVVLGYRSWEEYMQWNSIKWLFFIVDWDHAFHNFAKIPGSDDTFSHVLLTPWAQMFIGSCASVRFPCYEVLFFPLSSKRFPGEGNGYPFQYSCLENPLDWGAWQATVPKVAKNRAWLSD